jgi:DNA-binding transcriptional MerR regulator
MSRKLSIGDFSRMTFLSAKALRLYQEAGLLIPAEIDPATGYRSYDLSQVATAQVIRRFKYLGMPLEQIKAVLTVPDIAARNGLIASHLKQMEENLERTQVIVASLRALLETTPPPMEIEYRTQPALRVAAISAIVEWLKFMPWFHESFAELRHALRREGISAAGAQGGLFPTDFFTDEVAEVTLFVPISQPMAPSGNVFIRELPAVELAVAVHRGPYTDLDRTYGPLGAHVVDRTIGVAGPIREHFLLARDDVADDSQFATEIGWPIFRTIPNG